MHSYQTYNFASNFCARKLPVTLQPSVVIDASRKTCLSQIVLLQCKAKPYLGFQNLGCHFDTHKRLKKTLVNAFHTGFIWCERLTLRQYWRDVLCSPSAKFARRTQQNSAGGGLESTQWITSNHEDYITAYWTTFCAKWVLASTSATPS